MIEHHVYYLAGPMSGQPGFNYPLFDKTAHLLREKGHIIINPTDLDSPEEHERFRASADGNMQTLPKGMPTYEELKSDVLSVIETQLGRVRSANKYMDRTIDLDVLVFNGNEMDPELWTQAHVAVPAAQLLPDLRNTETGETLAASSKRLSKKADLEKVKNLP